MAITCRAIRKNGQRCGGPLYQKSLQLCATCNRRRLYRLKEGLGSIDVEPPAPGTTIKIRPSKPGKRIEMLPAWRTGTTLNLLRVQDRLRQREQALRDAQAPPEPAETAKP